MKKSLQNSKAILFSLAVLLFSTVIYSSCSDDNNEPENTIPASDLPQDAKNFLNQYFHSYEIIKVEKATRDNITIFEVDLQEGYEVVFNQAGDWLEVEAPENMTIPTGFIMPEIIQYVTDNYPDYGINEINKTGEGYNLELVTGLDLYFNMAGECTGVGDTY